MNFPYNKTPLLVSSLLVFLVFFLFLMQPAAWTEKTPGQGVPLEENMVSNSGFEEGFGRDNQSLDIPVEVNTLQNKTRKDDVVNTMKSNLETALPLKGEVLEIFEVGGRPAFLVMPKKKADGQPTPWVWYAPTLPNLPSIAEKWMFEKFLDAGIAIAGIDVGESYGNAKGCAIFSALYEELVQKRGLSSKPCLLARSRGGLMLYNWAADHPTSVACVAGVYPVCNLASYPGLARASGAYGMTEAELKGELTKHNPIDRIERLAKAQVPIFHIHGDVDTLVPLELNSGELIKRYRAFGGPAELVVPSGQGHSGWPGFFHCQELVDFVITHSNR